MDECLHCKIIDLMAEAIQAEPDQEKHGDILQHACMAIGQTIGAIITTDTIPSWVDYIRQVAEAYAAEHQTNLADDLANRPVAGNA